MELSAHERDHLRALVQSQNFDGVVEFMAAKVDGTLLPGVGTDTPPNEVKINPEDHKEFDSQRRPFVSGDSELVIGGTGPSGYYNDPKDPESELVIDDDPPHRAVTVGDLKKRKAASVNSDKESDS